MAIKSYLKSSQSKLSNNFVVNEFSCHGNGCCSTVNIDDKLVTFLQKIRDHFEKPVTINSGYRCATHNRNVGGASGSYHTKGMAADIAVKDIAPAEVAKYAESIGVLGIGLYETNNDGHFVHIDTRTSKSFWYGQAQTYRSTFGGKPQKAEYVPTVLEWQKAAIADGFKFPKYGADGAWGAECESVAKIAVCKKRDAYKHQNLTKFVQRVVGVDDDGLFGDQTKQAVINWQRKNGLIADGEFGINSYKKALGV